jgi:hypothetical protein
LRQLEARIAAADHDQVRGQVIKLERLDVRERPRLGKAGNFGNSGMRSDIEKDLIGHERARSSAMHGHFKSLRRDKAAAAHDQFGAACFVVCQVLGDLAFDHLALAAAHHRHVDDPRGGHGAELRCMTRQICDLGAANFILARHAGDVGTRPADPLPLDDGRALPRSGEMPRDQLAASPAAKHESIETFRLGHAPSPSESGLSATRRRRAKSWPSCPEAG